MVVVGGGILGTLHAWAALQQGMEVVHLEREAAPRGASVRNFGLVWVSGRAAGAELALALRSRVAWEALAAQVPGTGFRANGSLTVARSDQELAVLCEVAQRPDADDRGFELLDPEGARRVNPALQGAYLGALWCRSDAAVEPRAVLGAVRRAALATGRYTFWPGCEVTDVATGRATDHRGGRHDGDVVMVCTGANHTGLLGELLATAPLRRLRLQMLETAPYHQALSTSVADGDSLRYYPAFDGPARRRLEPQDPVAAAWGAQLLMVQRQDGSLTVGDTHDTTEPLPFDLDERPTGHLLEVAGALLGQPLPPVARRWAGVYSQLTEAAGDALYYRAEPAPGVQVVTGPGGRGMTLSAAIAHDTVAAL